MQTLLITSNRNTFFKHYEARMNNLIRSMLIVFMKHQYLFFTKIVYKNEETRNVKSLGHCVLPACFVE